MITINNKGNATSYGIVLSAGKGKRMGGNIPKQYLDLMGKPVIYYALKAFEDSNVDKIIVVVGKGEEEAFKCDIVEKYDFSKVCSIVTGGSERYLSVYNGLCEVKRLEHESELLEKGIVMIHDGARALITSDAINNAITETIKHDAVICGIHAKDTIQICDAAGNIINTPERSNTWIAQTPQCFKTQVAVDAYEKLILSGDDDVTDDAMVVKRYSKVTVKMIEAGCENNKITTTEDLDYAKMVLEKRNKM